MIYFFVTILIVGIVAGGPIFGAICGAGGIIAIFYMAFKWGPKLTLIAIPVAICCFVCMWLDDFASMYAKHLLIYVPICLIVTAIIFKICMGEGYKHIVFAITAGFIAVTMAGLAIWMYAPRQFPLSNKIDTVQVQPMDESIQAIFPNTPEMQELLEDLEKVEMRGTFKELTNFKGLGNTYRLTFLKQNGKEIDTYYFISKYYVAKKKGKRLIYYRWHDDSEFPYNKLVNMYNNTVGLDK